ncbi:MAG TPA: 50S ribosomal protein L23 [Chloroflexota bacterium]|jgi:large subunit ribosomal protein L23|nr:50S ribosomal protein L23 [Chloroflexota bacterium]
MELYDVLRRPLITEKNTMLGEQNKYTFEVAVAANKPMVRRAVEALFKVEVVDVNMIRVHGKMRRVGRNRGMTRNWKKAVVTLKPGQRIEVFGSA